MNILTVSFMAFSDLLSTTEISKKAETRNIELLIDFILEGWEHLRGKKPVGNHCFCGREKE